MTTAPAQKTLPKTPVRITSVLSGFALDVEDGSREGQAAVIQSSAPDTEHQHWRFIAVGDDQYRIENEYSGGVLDTKGASEAEGAPVIQLGWQARDTQRWQIVPVADGQYRIENVDSHKDIDVKTSKDKAPVILEKPHEGEDQMWRIDPVEEPVQVGTVLTWGQNTYSQLGTGPDPDRNTPAQVKIDASLPLDRVKALANASFHSLALLEDGTVRAWGNNGEGGLGDGSRQAKNVPVAVLARPGGEQLKGVKAIATGSYYGWGHSLALLEDGTVRAWGYGDYGQLGYGAKDNQFTPVAVKVDKNTELSGVKAIAGPMVEQYNWEGMFSLALLKNGTVRSWGYNYYNSLGDGSADTRLMPVTVVVDKGKPLTGVKALAAGAHHCLALLEDGTVRAWGYNDFGQLGNGNQSAQAFAVPVTINDKGDPLTGVEAIAAGGKFSLALMKDGTVRAWGRNNDGQLGIDSIEDRSKRPVVVKMAKNGAPLRGVKALAAGAYHSMALLEDGTLRAWGRNAHGQLGIGETTTNEKTPVVVRFTKGGEPLNAVTAIAAGAYHSMAIRGVSLSISPAVPPDQTLTLAGEVGYPGVHLAAEGTVSAAQSVRVTLPQGKGLRFVAQGGPAGHMLTVMDPVRGINHFPGNLSTDGQTLTFNNVDLALPQRGSWSRAWVAVKASPDALLGDTNLTFQIGDRTGPSTPIHVVDQTAE
ncbi:RCC1 domain-containing protein [Streptomyces halobius]|uniref:RICIN domain-containing protein n=1 Tax=Streptomyces halobius TaxID=2879846 RepID=A0ABY4MBB2_9ACTN|nr:RICIN domain-containing protein [Streptomyces halobius]UQA93700.1 RICIN domain-containing protein [Streptomyces halobius]